MTELHLWEVDHPYYCGEANYYGQNHTKWSSWADFRDGTIFTTGDRDMNLLVRWDWHSWRRHPDPSERSDSPDTLELFFVMQRKGYLASHSIEITDEDEPEVRAFLVECAQKMAQLWTPLDVASTNTGSKAGEVQ